MTSTSESLLLCARYIWTFVCMSSCMRVCYTHEKRVRPTLVGRLGRINVEHARVTNGILYAGRDWVKIISKMLYMRYGRMMMNTGQYRDNIYRIKLHNNKCKIQ